MIYFSETDSTEPNSIEINPTKNQNISAPLRELQNIKSWRITNDGVMGGKSQGSFTLHADHALFSGNISLENNGGFSSVYRTVSSVEKAVKNVSIDVKGDGLTYQLRLSVNVDGYRLAYKHNFNTTAERQEKLTFLLTDFQATFRGRNITTAPVLLSENIIEIGFLVTQKVSGPFLLAIKSIDFN